MSTAVAISIDGLGFAAWLFLASVGLTLIYGVMRILNIAHGSFYALGAFTSATFIGFYTTHELPGWGYFPVIFAAAITVGLVAGLLIERGILRFMYGRDEVLMVLVTYALFLILEDVTKIAWGADVNYAPYQPYLYLGSIEVMGIPYQVYDFALIGIAMLCGLLLWLGLNKTRTGKLLLVVIEDREISSALGINVKKLFLTTFIIGTTLGALGGALTAPKISISQGLGAEIIVMAFAVVVIGGMGSIGGAMVGAIFVGFARAASVHLMPQVELFAVFAVMALVLAVKPYGLFARSEGRKI